MIVSGVSKVFGGEALYENATFQINPGEKVGLVGKTVQGKLPFSYDYGRREADTGQISIQNVIRVSYFFQNISDNGRKKCR